MLRGISRPGERDREPVADVLPGQEPHQRRRDGGREMKVADLQQHLADLGRLLEAAKAPNVVADLAAIREGLAPFREYSLKDFASFLPRAEAFSRGEVPVVAPKRQRTGGTKTATTP